MMCWRTGVIGFVIARLDRRGADRAQGLQRVDQGPAAPEEQGGVGVLVAERREARKGHGPKVAVDLERVRVEAHARHRPRGPQRLPKGRRRGFVVRDVEAARGIEVRRHIEPL